MKVILEDDETEELKGALSLEEAPGVEKNLDGFRARKHGEPSDDSARHEVGIFGFVESVTVAGHGDSLHKGAGD